MTNLTEQNGISGTVIASYPHNKKNQIFLFIGAAVLDVLTVIFVVVGVLVPNFVLLGIGVFSGSFFWWATYHMVKLASARHEYALVITTDGFVNNTNAQYPEMLIPWTTVKSIKFDYLADGNPYLAIQSTSPVASDGAIGLMARLNAKMGVDVAVNSRALTEPLENVQQTMETAWKNVTNQRN